MMKSLITTAFALAALSAAGSAQQQVQQIDSVQQVKHATLDLATGVTTRDAQSDKCGLVLSWLNTDYSGYYSIPGPGSEWIVAGDITAGVHNHVTDIVGMFEFAYGSSVLDTLYGGPGASVCISFYDNIVGWCGDSGLGLLPTANFCWTGLAGGPDGVTAWGWIYTVTLTGGFEFLQDDGDFGYSMNFFDSSTGPLLMYSGSIGGGLDTNGQDDVFDLYVPDVATGTCGSYWFGGVPNNFSSWWMALYVGDGVPTASANWYCGAAGNNIATDAFVVTGPPTLGGTFDVSIGPCGASSVGGLIAGFSSPLDLPSKWGDILINIADPNGELTGLPAGFGNPAVISLGVPINLAFCGFTFYVQAASFGGGVCLHCAWDATIGF